MCITKVRKNKKPKGRQKRSSYRGSLPNLIRGIEVDFARILSKGNSPTVSLRGEIGGKERWWRKGGDHTEVRI